MNHLHRFLLALAALLLVSASPPSMAQVVDLERLSEPHVEVIKDRISKALGCEWEIIKPYERLRCGGNNMQWVYLHSVDDHVASIELNHINPDSRAAKGELEESRKYVMKLITALLPRWVDAKIWIDASFALTERCCREFKATATLYEAVVTVEHVLVMSFENGVTMITITPPPPDTN